MPPSFRWLRLRARMSRAFGVTPRRRAWLIRQLLEGHARSAPAYWLQLSLAVGIAVFGLVLDNTGVVIGAMLVSPLMEPIVALGLGLTVGSAVITLRAFLRLVWSVLAALVGAAAITAALPFHEVTREIAARAAPTALDLLVAAFCAVAAAFTTVRVSSDGATAAAGTAIAIALVPPLSVVGFGLGTGNLQLARGASLLFIANFCAILLVAVVAFLLVGFSGASLRHAGPARGDGHLSGRAGLALQSLFGSRLSPLLRFSMPAVLLAIVYVPLSRALEEVTWQVRTRKAVERTLHAAEVGDRMVRSSLAVEQGAVAVQLVVVGRTAEAEALERRLTTELAAATGVSPQVEVRAVSEAARESPVNAQVTAPLAPAPPADWAGAQREISEVLAASWPSAAAGPLVHWRAEPGRGRPSRLQLIHVGEPIGPAAERLLSGVLSRELRSEIEVRALALPKRLESGGAPPPAAFLLTAVRLLEQIATLDSLTACLTWPPPPVPRRGRQRAAGQPPPTAWSLLGEALRQVPGGRARQQAGPTWLLEIGQPGCSNELNASPAPLPGVPQGIP